MRKQLGSLRLMYVTYAPGQAGDALRIRYWKPRLKHLGENVRIDIGVQFVNPQFVSIGENAWVDKYVVLLAGPPTEGERKITRKTNDRFHHNEGDLVIGTNVHIASHVLINAHGGVEIGDNSAVAAGAKIVSLSHHHRNLSDGSDAFMYSFGSRVPQREQALISGPVVLEENTGLATNAVMLPGSSLGRNSWATIGSLVMGAIEPDCIASGSPAKPVKSRKKPLGLVGTKSR